MIAMAAAMAVLSAGPERDEVWRTRPSNKEMILAWPHESRDVDYARVVIRCTQGADGRLLDCSVLSETPPGRGFGAAALSLTGRFRLKPDAVVAGRGIQTPIVFRVAR